MLILSLNFGCEQIYKIWEITFGSHFVIKLKSDLDVQQTHIWSHFVIKLKSDLYVPQTHIWSHFVMLHKSELDVKQTKVG